MLNLLHRQRSIGAFNGTEVVKADKRAKTQ